MTITWLKETEPVYDVIGAIGEPDVLADADLGFVVEAFARGWYLRSRRTCFITNSAGRCSVFVGRVNSLEVGDPSDHTTFVEPVQATVLSTRSQCGEPLVLSDTAGWLLPRGADLRSAINDIVKHERLSQPQLRTHASSVGDLRASEAPT